MLSISLSLQLSALEQKLKKIASAEWENEVLDEALSILLNRIRTRFLDELDPEGKPWLPSKAGLKRRAAGGSGTLFRTGTLWHSIQAAQAPVDHSRMIATDTPYAIYLQGKDFTGRWVFLGFGPDDLKVYEALVFRRISEVLNG